MAEHTPIPWRRNGHFVETATKPPFAVCDVYGDGQILQEVGDLIVRAVNCHEELVAALKAVEWIPLANRRVCPNCSRRWDQGHAPTCKLAAALAKAKEGALDESQMLLQDLDEETL